MGRSALAGIAATGGTPSAMTGRANGVAELPAVARTVENDRHCAQSCAWMPLRSCGSSTWLEACSSAPTCAKSSAAASAMSGNRRGGRFSRAAAPVEAPVISVGRQLQATGAVPPAPDLFRRPSRSTFDRRTVPVLLEDRPHDRASVRGLSSGRGFPRSPGRHEGHAELPPRDPSAGRR